MQRSGNVREIVRDYEGSGLKARWNTPTVLEVSEILNLFNRVESDPHNRIFGGFQRIFGAKSPREMRFGLRLGLLASRCESLPLPRQGGTAAALHVQDR